MTQATLIRITFNLGLAYRFRGSVHYHQGRKHGSIQAGIALEERRVLHLVLKGNKRLSWVARRRVSKPTPSVTHFLHGHTYSNKATPPNSTIPWAKHIQTTTLTESILYYQIALLVPWFIFFFQDFSHIMMGESDSLLLLRVCGFGFFFILLVQFKIQYLHPWNGAIRRCGLVGVGVAMEEVSH